MRNQKVFTTFQASRLHWSDSCWFYGSRTTKVFNFHVGNAEEMSSCKDVALNQQSAAKSMTIKKTATGKPLDHALHKNHEVDYCLCSSALRQGWFSFLQTICFAVRIDLRLPVWDIQSEIARGCRSHKSSRALVTVNRTSVPGVAGKKSIWPPSISARSCIPTKPIPDRPG